MADLTLTAVLLAGGESRRMARDKAALVLHGEPLWQRQLRLLHQLGPHALWLSARQVPLWRPPGVEVVIDPSPPRGPLAGLLACLRRLATSHVLFLAIDLPQMTSGHLFELWRLARPGQAVIPRQPEGWEPLCAFYPAGARTVAEACFGEGNFTLQGFCDQLRDLSLAQTYTIPPEQRPLYANVNTPADWARLQPATPSAAPPNTDVSTAGVR